MKILFVIPYFSLKERYGNLESVGSYYPSLGIAYIAGVAEKLGHDVKIIDSVIENIPIDNLKDEIVKFKPDLVGMQTFFTTIQECYKIASIVKSISSDIKVVLGGPQVTLFPDDAIKRKEIDFVICGEGETSFEKLLISLESEKNINNIEKIYSKPCLVNDLDTLPLPARHLFRMEKYRSAADHRGKNVYHLMTSRGCPYRCAFCAASQSFGKTFRFHKSHRVIDEIKYLIEKYKADELHFFDDIFTMNRERIIDLCDKMIGEGLKIPWTCETRVNKVDIELLKKMRKAGCYKISYGVESGVPRLLKLIRKEISLDQCRDAFKNTKLAGIETMGLFMLGLPTETVEESMQTIDFSLELNPDFVQFAITTPFPGTDLYNLALENGKVITNDYKRYTSWEVVYVTNNRTEKEIYATVKKAYRRFYTRPSYITKRTISLLKYHPYNIYRLFKAGVKIISQ